MNPFKRMIAGLGAQTAPFGFTANDPNAAYRAGWGVIGDMGANMLANNQPGVDPFANLGASLQQAKADSTTRNKEQYTAQRLMEEAAAKRQEREQAEAERMQREEFLKSLPPDVQMKARSVPGFLESYVQATDPNLQKPERPTFMEVNGKIVNPMTGEVVFDGGGMSADAPEVKTIFDPETGQEQVVQWSGAGWEPLGGPKARGGGADIGSQVEERKAAAEAMGITPDDPAYRSYILTGKMPREDQAPLTAGDKAAIREADLAVRDNKLVIKQLRSVVDGPEGQTLNDRAGYGALANAQSWIARNDGTGIFDDAKGEATTELKNVVLGQALASLKSIFGAAPTEGERQILIDLQASVDKTPTERKKIIERAIDLAEIRLQYNEDVAKGLRGETYYKPGGGPNSEGWTDVGGGVRIRQKGQ
jgi:hypothetical protein